MIKCRLNDAAHRKQIDKQGFDEDSMIIRIIEPEDAEKVSALIVKTLREVNIKDYSREYIEKIVERERPEDVLERAEQTNFYVVCDEDKIVGCGAIGPYWDKADESCFFSVFVLPEYQGQGIGRTIIETLEKLVIYKIF